MVEEVDNLADEKSDTKKVVHDHPVFKTIADGDMETMRNYFEVEGVSLEVEDGTGMTPLMHASWKGQQDVAKYLLKQGADPNGGNHEHHYTSLHFAGLAGKPHICSLLLEAGAKTHHTNSVSRTAAGSSQDFSQYLESSFLITGMAAFVGNHDCVAIINNYVPKEDILYFTRKQPFEEEPKLSPELAKPLHDLVMMMNTHPVR